MKGALIIKIKQRRMYYEFDFLYIYFFLTYKALLITKDDKSTSLKMSKVQHISFVYRQLNAPIDGFLSLKFFMIKENKAATGVN